MYKQSPMKSNFIGLNDRQLYLFLSTEVNFVCWELSLRLRTTKGWGVLLPLRVGLFTQSLTKFHIKDMKLIRHKCLMCSLTI